MKNELDADKKSKQDICARAINIIVKEVTSLYLIRAGILEQLNAFKRASEEYNAILSLSFLLMQFNQEESMTLRKFALESMKRADAE